MVLLPKGGTGSLLLMLFLAIAILAVLVLSASAAGENTPPSVSISSPKAGARLALSVTISGTASDTEGFNASSLVQARWNNWEWFELPTTPAQGGRALHFGETVDLHLHAPGEHNLSVRAFDGGLWSPEVNVTVEVRDLVDLVILPTGITVDPEEPRGGDTVVVTVVVENQGGEEAKNAVVVLTSDGEELDRRSLPRLSGGSSGQAEFELEVDEGELALVATVEYPDLEASDANNEATLTLTVLEEEPRELSWIQVLVLVVVVVSFCGLVYYARTHPK